MKLAAISGIPESESLSLTKLTDRIILGPLSSDLSLHACMSMVEACGHAELRDRIRRSSIPFAASKMVTGARRRANENLRE